MSPFSSDGLTPVCPVLGSVIPSFIVRNTDLVFIFVSGTELLKPLESPKW